MSWVQERTRRLNCERLGRVGKASSSLILSVAVEVPLAGEAGPPGEEGEGDDLAFGEGGFGAGSLFWRMGVAEVVNRNVKCGEEGVHIDHERSRFLSLRDRVASRL